MAALASALRQVSNLKAQLLLSKALTYGVSDFAKKSKLLKEAFRGNPDDRFTTYALKRAFEERGLSTALPLILSFGDIKPRHILYALKKICARDDAKDLLPHVMNHHRFLLPDHAEFAIRTLAHSGKLDAFPAFFRHPKIDHDDALLDYAVKTLRSVAPEQLAAFISLKESKKSSPFLSLLPRTFKAALQSGTVDGLPELLDAIPSAKTAFERAVLDLSDQAATILPLAETLLKGQGHAPLESLMANSYTLALALALDEENSSIPSPSASCARHFSAYLSEKKRSLSALFAELAAHRIDAPRVVNDWVRDNSQASDEPLFSAAFTAVQLDDTLNGAYYLSVLNARRGYGLSEDELEKLKSVASPRSLSYLKELIDLAPVETDRALRAV